MNNWALKTKIVATVGTVLALLAFISGLAVWVMSEQTSTANEALKRMSDAMEAHDVLVQALRAYQNQADTIINQNADGKDFATNIAGLADAIKRYNAATDTADEKAWAGSMEKASAAFAATFQQEVLPRVKQLAESKDAAEKARLLEELRAVDGKSDEVLKGLLVDAEKGINSLLAESKRTQDHYVEFAGRMEWWVVVLSVVTCLVGAILGLFVAQRISKTVSGVAGVLSSGAEQTASAAGQVSSSSQSLAEGSSEQAASLEETSSSLEEMSSMTKRNAENAHKANDLARDARRAADAGVADMQAMATAMNDIKVSSDDIGKIIKTIDEIAFQTNILALNAAVEAARAGEAGMGFAVVADEVRNLAQRSAVAAKETAGKIEGAIAKTALGVQLTDKVAKVLQEIVTKARQVDELVAEVANASKEQTQGIDQLNVAIGQIDKVTQSNAANAEESASAAEEMSAQTVALKEAVAELLALVNGSDGGQRTVVTGGAGRGVHSFSSAPAKRSPRVAAQGRSNGTPRNPAEFEHAIIKPAVLTAPNRGAAPAMDMFKDIGG